MLLSHTLLHTHTLSFINLAHNTRRFVQVSLAILLFSLPHAYDLILFFFPLAEFGYYQTTDASDQPFGSDVSLSLSLKQCLDVFGINTSDATIRWTNDYYGKRERHRRISETKTDTCTRVKASGSTQFTKVAIYGCVCYWSEGVRICTRERIVQL